MAEFASIDELVADDRNVHVECSRETSAALLAAVRARYRTQRCAFVVETDRGFERDSVAAHLRFYGSIARSSVHHEDAIAHFNLRGVAKRKMGSLSPSALALVNLARASLFEPEACFLERPLSDLDAEGRAIALSWIAEHMEQGCRFITTVEPLREALLMPGVACWHEEGRFIMVDQDDDGDDDRESAYEGDEVRVLKIPARTETATLLFDPRDIDFAESMNKATYLVVRGERYQTPRTMDELEAELSRAGFFRCHRSFLVNVQKVAKVEHYTRNSFNLTLNDAARTSIPLAKGRAEEMRERYRW
ncbi:LytTR family transcriptional regulator DNA-binding domain-containing protein [Gordonibacter pamelaeae]|uniref:Response regulator of the LytR/AlgR family n=1 Tax=Gordonibacter pamelaeae 7-10-1-b TaxID=657308 RepID=D6EA88_9ACTN|nr:LytTR family transcriptional regulator DNA-binding domain-containing protein [Gordonibacter pamelaeae]CBL04635.1 Response regulator of the LytR/AlgR family [Gordonibacter pamelaeae 7-10-1-b]